jgi:uncharacterized circularly permuted ATP-grasp superfamily protein
MHHPRKEIEDYKNEILKAPRNFIAQPTISLSASPCYIQGELAAKAYRFKRPMPFAAQTVLK